MPEFLSSQAPRLYVLVGILILLSILFLVSWSARQLPGRVKLYLAQGGIISAFTALLALVITNRLHWVFAVIGGLLPIVIRLLPWLKHSVAVRSATYSRRKSRGSNSQSSSSKPGGNSKASASSRRSRVETRFLRMSLDEGGSNMRGVISKGKYAGAHLSELSLAQLRQLHEDYRARDAESAALLTAYIDCMRGGESPAQDQEEAQSEDTEERSIFGKGMTRDEAYEILGLKQGAGAQEVTDAHRRLMQKLHPDRGGTNYLAAKINQAKALLLER